MLAPTFAPFEKLSLRSMEPWKPGVAPKFASLLIEADTPGSFSRFDISRFLSCTFLFKEL